jgi:hypothetical protein
LALDETRWNHRCHTPFKKIRAEIKEWSNSTTRGHTMPAFTFEKISPPKPHDSTAVATPAPAKKQRGVMVQIFGRLTETRARRAQQIQQSLPRRDPQQKG